MSDITSQEALKQEQRQEGRGNYGKYRQVSARHTPASAEVSCSVGQEEKLPIMLACFCTFTF